MIHTYMLQQVSNTNGYILSKLIDFKNKKFNLFKI